MSWFNRMAPILALEQRVLKADPSTRRPLLDTSLDAGERNMVAVLKRDRMVRERHYGPDGTYRDATALAMGVNVVKAEVPPSVMGALMKFRSAAPNVNQLGDGQIPAEILRWFAHLSPSEREAIRGYLTSAEVPADSDRGTSMTQPEISSVSGAMLKADTVESLSPDELALFTRILNDRDLLAALQIDAARAHAIRLAAEQEKARRAEARRQVEKVERSRPFAVIASEPARPVALRKVRTTDAFTVRIDGAARPAHALGDLLGHALTR